MRKTPACILLLFAIVACIIGCSKGKNQNVVEPAITSIYPTAAGGGDTVTARGKNLPTNISDIHISVNNKSARIITATPDSIQAVVPELSGSGKVTLKVGAESFEGPLFTYKYEAIVTTIAGDGSVGSSDGQGASASFNCPWGIAADADDNLFIADCYNRLIRKISTPGYDVSAYTIPTWIDSSNFYSPYNLAVHPATHDLYVTDFNAHVMRMDQAGNAKMIYVGEPPMAGIAVSPDGNSLFVGNNTNGTITKMNIDGTNATAFSHLVTPRNIIFDKQGQLFVAAFPGPVYKIAADGSAAEAVTALPAFQGWEIATDSLGNFFLADHFSNCIRIIDKNGNASIVAGSGDAEDKDGIGLEASFNGPQGITIDSKGYLYVTTYNYDTKGGNKVRRIELR